MSDTLDRFYMRIFIIRLADKNANGGEPSIIYNRAGLYDITDIQKEEYDNTQNLKIGDTFIFKGGMVTVKNISFVLFDHTVDTKLTDKYGLNISNETERTDFNCSLVVEVF